MMALTVNSRDCIARSKDLKGAIWIAFRIVE